MNLFLESCLQESKKYNHLGIETFKSLSKKRISPNNGTFGILVKIYGKLGELKNAMKVLHRMKRFRVRPGPIIFTNLVQVCFNLKRTDKALEVYEEMLALRVIGDQIFYEKMI